MGYTITGIDQDRSVYDKDGGTFIFNLSGTPDAAWLQKFSDAINSQRGRHFSKAPFVTSGYACIEAKADLEGSRGLVFVSEMLVSILEDVNYAYDQEKHEQAEAERKRKAERTALEVKVSEIISKIKFN
ncbi:hypothetical protein ACPUEX_14860 [Enterobacter vonholyi]